MTTTLLRRPARTSVPAMSIVIASVNGWDVLRPTLASIDALPERDRIEVIVVETLGGDTRAKLRSHRPEITMIEVEERLPIPRLRYLGVQKALGELVAILEDHVEVDASWASSLFEIHQEPWGAVGGAVENGRSEWLNWAVFFCEYTPYMLPVIEGSATDIPGNNIAYKRPHLLKHARLLDEGKWESWINDRLRADGVAIASTNRAIVRHIKPFRLGYFLVQRFHFARSYAGMRRTDQSWAKRVIFGFGSLILPPLLLARVSKTVFAKKRHLGKFVACLPLIALFMSVGAVGEMMGYFLGAGRSLDRVE